VANFSTGGGALVYMAPCRGPLTVSNRHSLASTRRNRRFNRIADRPAAPGSIRASAPGADSHLIRLSGPRLKPT